MIALQHVLPVALAMFIPALASAQSRVTFTESGLLKPGQMITVDEANGETFKGEILAVTSTSLTVARGDAWQRSQDTRTFDVSGVTSIRKRDSVTNGFVFGLGAGYLVGLASTKGLCSPRDPECEAIVTTYLLLPMVAGGGAIGAAIDYAFRKTLFSAPSTSDAQLSVAPIIGRHTRGAALSVSF